MDAEIIGAWIAAGAALVVAAIGVIAGERNRRRLNEDQGKLETYKGELAAQLESAKAIFASQLESTKAGFAESQAERDARRDYEYEARKRLYEQYEPLLFQLVELSEAAYSGITGLSRTARQGNLIPGSSGWLGGEGYYFLRTMHRLLSPLVVVSLIQRRLTLVDVGLDARIGEKYVVAKQLYKSFTDDYAFAEGPPRLAYQPEPSRDGQVSPISAQSNLKADRRQGIFRGLLDNAVEALTVRDDATGLYRPMSFGTFAEEYGRADSEVRARFRVVADLLLDFHPKQQPVFWRMLVTQAHLYAAIVQNHSVGQASSGQVIRRPWEALPEANRKPFDWRQSEEESSEEEVLKVPFQVAEAYLRMELDGASQGGVPMPS